jgi:hypothetical protein
VFVLSVVSGARAAAPLCDEQAQTIAAPAPLTPVKPGTLNVVRCVGELLQRLNVAPLPPERQPDLNIDFGHRVLPALSHIALETRGVRRPLRALQDMAGPPGHDTGVYRPPRAR